MASSGLKPFAVSCAESSSRAKASRLPASEEAMERSTMHPNDGREAGVSRRSFLGGASETPPISISSAVAPHVVMMAPFLPERPGR
jgi:hypothetical protein